MDDVERMRQLIIDLRKEMNKSVEQFETDVGEYDVAELRGLLNTLSEYRGAPVVPTDQVVDMKSVMRKQLVDTYKKIHIPDDEIERRIRQLTVPQLEEWVELLTKQVREELEFLEMLRKRGTTEKVS